MKRPNPLAPCHLKPLERRAELCAILALGLRRLHARNASELSANAGESTLHSPPDQKAYETPTHWRDA